MIENLSTITAPYIFNVVEIQSFYTECRMKPAFVKLLVFFLRSCDCAS